MARDLNDLQLFPAQVDHIPFAEILRLRKAQGLRIDALQEFAVLLPHRRVPEHLHESLDRPLIQRPVRRMHIHPAVPAVIKPLVSEHMVAVPVGIDHRHRQVSQLRGDLLQVAQAEGRVDQAGLFRPADQVHRRRPLLIDLERARRDPFDVVNAVLLLCHFPVLLFYKGFPASFVFFSVP